MTDVFITTAERNETRDYFYSLTQEAIVMSGFSPQIVKKPMLERYFECDERATTDIYVVCDDDIIPATHTTIKELIDILELHPHISQLGLAWKRNLKQHEIIGWLRGTIADDVWEMDHVGGCVAIRKGSVKDTDYVCNYEEGIGDDKVMAMIARDGGYKVGLAHNLYFHHLGQGFSTVWK